MMVRLDFTPGEMAGARALRVRKRPEPGVALLAEAGPHLPFRDGSIDEMFLGREVAWRSDVAETLDAVWRACKPGALVHLTLPHASSVLAVSRDPRPRPLLTLNTFNYYDPQNKPADAPATSFTVERAALRVAGERSADSGLALARGRFARVVEKFANSSRGSQYRFERWFGNIIGFEEFEVVLSVVKGAGREQGMRMADEPAAADPTTMHVTSDVAHEAANVDADDLAPASGAGPAEPGGVAARPYGEDRP